MSYDNAISVRGQMNLTYQQMLADETNPQRIEDIKKQIKLNDLEINQLRQGKPLFGAPIVLKQETKIIETDPETKEQKITTLDEKGKLVPDPAEVEEIAVDTKEVVEEQKEEIVASTPASNKKLGNKLRDILQAKNTSSAEETLKAKVMAAKAAKSQTT